MSSVSFVFVQGEPVADLPRDERTFEQLIIFEPIEHVRGRGAGRGLECVLALVWCVELGKRLVQEFPGSVNAARGQCALVSS